MTWKLKVKMDKGIFRMILCGNPHRSFRGHLSVISHRLSSSSTFNRLIIFRPRLNFCCSVPILENWRATARTVMALRRPLPQFQPPVWSLCSIPQSPSGPLFGQPNYPPQYSHHPPPPPQHQPPFQHPPPHQQNNWNHPEFHNHPPDYRPQTHFNGEMSEGFGNGGLRPNCGNQNANLGRKRPRIHSDRTVPAGIKCLVKHETSKIASLVFYSNIERGMYLALLILIELITCRSWA